MRDGNTSSDRSDSEVVDRPAATAGPIRVVFFGTPAFAVPSLRRLVADDRFDVGLVVTQPDRPAGRGRKQEPSPVKRAADGFQIPIYQPETLRSPELRAPLQAVHADVFVVSAYGLIFGPKTLAIPRHGCVNVHASLLPRYRGASPITAAILAGDDKTGVTLMVMDAGLDTGPTLGRAESPIAPGDTTADLIERLAGLGADLLEGCLSAFIAGRLSPRPQPANDVSVTRPLVKADGWLRWQLPAPELQRRVRAMWPWPRAWTLLDGQPFQVHTAEAVTTPSEDLGVRAGTLVDVDGEPAVVCGDGVLVLQRVQPAGGKAMDGRSFLAGRRYALTQVLGAGSEPPPTPPLVRPLIEERPHGPTT